MKQLHYIDKSKLERIYKTVAIFLQSTETVDELKNAYISSIKPLASPLEKEQTFFEVKFAKEMKSNNGYVIVSTSFNYPPIQVFCTGGITPTEYLSKKIGHQDFIACYFSPFFMVAENDKGIPIEIYGDLPTPFINTSPLMKSENLKYFDYKKIFVEHRKLYAERAKSDIKKSWMQFVGEQDTGLASDIGFLGEDEIQGTYSSSAGCRKPERISRFTQLGPGQSGNNEIFPSGCVSCAWMCLYGYYNNLDSGEILRGTHYDNNTIRSGLADDTGCDYVDRLTMELSRYLDTHGGGGFSSDTYTYTGGFVDNADIDKGYGFISNELHTTYANADLYIEDGDPTPVTQKVYDTFCQHTAPSIVGTDSHAMICYRILITNVTTIINFEMWYLKVYDGWQGVNDYSSLSNNLEYDKYVPYTEFVACWTLAHINSRRRIGLNVNAISPPQTDSSDSIQYIVYRLDAENIEILCSRDGLDFTIKDTIRATGTGMPVISTGNKYFYLGWIDENNNIKLASGNVSGSGIKIISALPVLNVSVTNINSLRISAKINQVILAFDGRILSTTINKLNADPTPWPANEGNLENGCFSYYLGINQILDVLELSSYILISFQRQGVSRIMLLDKETGQPLAESESPGHILEYHNNKTYIMEIDPWSYSTTRKLSEVTILHWNSGIITFEFEPVLYPSVAANCDLTSFTNSSTGPYLVSVGLNNNILEIDSYSVDTKSNRLDYTNFP